MLVLTRKTNEEIFIGEGEDRIVIMVVSVQQGRVKLGISAPPEQRILRAELLEEPKARPA